MKRFADDVKLPPRWWWGSVAAIVVVALIFFAVGAAIPAIVCLLFAGGVAYLAYGADEPREQTTQASSDHQSSRRAAPSD